MLYNNFNEALAAGNVGENMVAEMLTSYGYKVTDVSDDKTYFAKDIDLLADFDDQHLEIEVKSDARVADTGNVVLETFTNLEFNKKGWFFTTKATHIFFADVNNRVVHCVRLDELKDLFRRKQGKMKTRVCHQWECEQFYKESEIVLCPVSLLETTEHYVKLADNIAA